MHKDATAKLQAKYSPISIDSMLDTNTNKAQKFHQDMLLKVLQCVRYLARQGLPLHGHYESPELFQGNLCQLLLLQAEGNVQMKQWLNNKECTSPQIITDIIQLMGLAVVQKILADIKILFYYALIVDEATDIAQTEQLCISVRWLDYNFGIHEDCIGLIP